MKSQNQLVLDLKAKIQATLKLIALKIKRYVLQLLDLEQKLEVAMSDQLRLEGIEKALQQNNHRYAVQEGSPYANYDKRIVLLSQVVVNISDYDSLSYSSLISEEVARSLGFELDNNRWYVFFKNDFQISMRQAWGEYDADLP